MFVSNVTFQLYVKLVKAPPVFTNTRDEMLHKTIASEGWFLLYSQRQLEKKALSAVIKNHSTV